MTLSKLANYSKKFFLFILTIVALVWFLNKLAPTFPTVFENWLSFSIYVNYFKWLTLIIIFVYWSDIASFFLNDKSKLSAFNSQRLPLMVLVIGVETMTWLIRNV